VRLKKSGKCSLADAATLPKDETSEISTLALITANAEPTRLRSLRI
jgi:hypothetical protein